MGLSIRYATLAVVMMIVSSLTVMSPVSAQHSSNLGNPTPIIFSGTVTHFGAPVVDYSVVAWCSDDLDKFGGSDNTDEHGFFQIRTTDGDNCPLGNPGFVEVFHDGPIVGYSSKFTIHSQNTVNIKLEGSGPISVPEFGWIGGMASLTATSGVISLAHRRYVRKLNAC